MTNLIISLSLIDPEGCITALTPDWTSFSIPSTNGKKASDAAIEFGSQVTWRSRDTDAVAGKVARSHDQLQVTVSVLHNNRRDWGLDMSSQSTGQGQVCTWIRCGIFFSFPLFLL